MHCTILLIRTSTGSLPELKATQPGNFVLIILKAGSKGCVQILGTVCPIPIFLFS